MNMIPTTKKESLDDWTPEAIAKRKAEIIRVREENRKKAAACGCWKCLPLLRSR